MRSDDPMRTTTRCGCVHFQLNDHDYHLISGYANSSPRVPGRFRQCPQRLLVRWFVQDRPAPAVSHFGFGAALVVRVGELVEVEYDLAAILFGVDGSSVVAARGTLVH